VRALCGIKNENPKGFLRTRKKGLLEEQSVSDTDVTVSDVAIFLACSDEKQQQQQQQKGTMVKGS